MGMDVHGINPTTEAGKCFRNSIWWWHPLADYIIQFGPAQIVSKVESWHTNDGDGLNGADALNLAKWLRDSLAAGTFDKFDHDGRMFSAENVANFATFLEDSGGFSID